MINSWKNFISAAVIGFAVLAALSVKDGEAIFSSKNFSLILGYLTFYALLFLFRYWRNGND